jgi:hypothetical protein
MNSGVLRDAKLNFDILLWLIFSAIKSVALLLGAPQTGHGRSICISDNTVND